MIHALMDKALFTRNRYTDGGRDPLGKPTRVLDSSEVYDGRLEQTKSVEPSGEALVVNSYRAFFPPDADVRADDEIVCEGLVYTVQGAPSNERIPGFPALSNIAAVLQYVGPVDS